ncbi:MAG: NUDIX hydrolase [Pseudomonadota bacterium]
MDETNQTKATEKFWAGGFLYNPENASVFLHQRDGNTKFNPHKWAFFGGLNEGPESHRTCFIRELKEEIAYSAVIGEPLKLREYMNTELSTYRVVYFLISNMELSNFELGEGAGFNWINLENIDKYDLTDLTREDLDFFISTILS